MAFVPWPSACETTLRQCEQKRKRSRQRTNPSETGRVRRRKHLCSSSIGYLRDGTAGTRPTDCAEWVCGESSFRVPILRRPGSPVKIFGQTVILATRPQVLDWNGVSPSTLITFSPQVVGTVGSICVTVVPSPCTRQRILREIRQRRVAVDSR